MFIGFSVTIIVLWLAIDSLGLGIIKKIRSKSRDTDSDSALASDIVKVVITGDSLNTRQLQPQTQTLSIFKKNRRRLKVKQCETTAIRVNSDLASKLKLPTIISLVLKVKST